MPSKTKAAAKFLDIVYADICRLVEEYETVLPYKKEDFKQDLFRLVSEKMKRSFQNGIELGLKRAKPAKRSD